MLPVKGPLLAASYPLAVICYSLDCVNTDTLRLTRCQYMCNGAQRWRAYCYSGRQSSMVASRWTTSSS